MLKNQCTQVSGDKNNVKCPAIRTTSIFGKLKVSADKNNVGHSTLFLSPDTSVLKCHYVFAFKDILWSLDFSPFFTSVFSNFPQFSLQNNGRKATLNAQPSRALKKHRVRTSNFFHIFARTVPKTSFPALNWWVAVKTRG